MTSSLQLRLERPISSSRLSNVLTLSLDRKLGELSRYTYVYADALPLRMERGISEQLAPNQLSLAITNPRGVLMPPRYVTANALPLPLSVSIAEQPAANVLPLGISRKLGTIFGAPIIVPPVDPTDPTDPELPDRPLMPNIAACFGAANSVALSVNRCYAVSGSNSSVIARDYRADYTQTIAIARSFSAFTRQMILVSNCHKSLSSQSYHLATCKRSQSLAAILLVQDTQAITGASIGYSACSKIQSATIMQQVACDVVQTQATIHYGRDGKTSDKGYAVESCYTVKNSKSVSVPCRYYPIPEPPPDKPTNTCRIRPPSNQLPLRMPRQRKGLLSSNLPLSLTCWHDDPPLFIHSLRTYIMHNLITANIGGIAVDPLGFNIKTDMDSYCWSGGVSISPDDHAKIKHKLDVDIGLEPMINVMLNDIQFGIIAENHSRTRRFGNQTHSLDGRSITARLGADYAAASDRLFDQANYASQIVNEQLANLPFTANFEIDDWLIPASTYAVSNKTPIAVIADIAEAAGGFVESHPTDATMSIKKRWKINAWELATATPDVTIPADVIKSATDKTVKNTRYNTILLVGNVGHEIFRATQGRDAPAPTLSNALFTAREVTVPKASAVLSDSGTHSIQTLDLIFDDSIPLAQLGQIWQINDTDGAWRGVITGVALDCPVVGDVPEPKQTITIDRYLDN